MVYGLKVPDPFARLAVDTDNALREQVVARAHAAIPIVGGGADWEVDVPKLLVDRHRCPDIGVAAVSPRFAVPGISAELVALRNGVEDPLHGPGARVETANVPRWRFFGPGLVLQRAPDHHGVAYDGDLCRMGDAAAVDRASERNAEIDQTAVAEVRFQGARPGIERHQSEIVRGDEDARIVAALVAPVRGPSVLPADVGRLDETVVRTRVVGPHLFARASVERGHLA